MDNLKATRELALQWAMDYHNNWTMWGRSNSSEEVVATAARFYEFLVAA